MLQLIMAICVVVLLVSLVKSIAFTLVSTLFWVGLLAAMGYAGYWYFKGKVE